MIKNSSFISPNAKIHPNVKIGPFCFIGDGVVIGENSILKSHFLFAIAFDSISIPLMVTFET